MKVNQIYLLVKTYEQHKKAAQADLIKEIQTLCVKNGCVRGR